MTKRDLLQLDREGLVPALLAFNWQKFSQREDNPMWEIRWRTHYIQCLLMSLFVAVVIFVCTLTTNNTEAKGLFFGALFVLISQILWYILKLDGLITANTTEHKRFCSDLTRLTVSLNIENSEAGSLIHYGQLELEEMAKDRLTGIARNVILTQASQGYGSRVADAHRNSFKDAHSTFLRFGLVVEDWGVYFARAEDDPDLIPNVAPEST